MNSRVQRIVLFLFVVVGHAALLLGLSRIRLSAPRVTSEYYGALIMIDERKPATKRPSKLRDRMFVVPRPKDATPLESESPPLSTTPVAIPMIDWQWQGAHAATDVVARSEEEKRRSVSKPKTIEQPSTPKDTVSLFPAPLHKNGDTQSLGDGETITWVSDTCYATNRPFAGPQLDENTLHVVCKDPFKGRTDLFDHLKPKYLQEAPIPNETSAESTAPICSYSSFRCK